MPHIHTQPGQHDLTASGFIILLGDGEPKLLVHEHLKLHKLMQYGGHVELDETPWDAVLHEIREESGYDPDQLQLLQPVPYFAPTGDNTIDPVPVSINTHPFGGDTSHYHTDMAYAFITREAPRNRQDDRESADHVKLTKAELEALGTDRMFDNVKQIGLFVFTVIDAWQLVNMSEYRQ